MKRGPPLNLAAGPGWKRSGLVGETGPVPAIGRGDYEKAKYPKRMRKSVIAERRTQSGPAPVLADAGPAPVTQLEGPVRAGARHTSSTQRRPWRASGPLPGSG